MIHIYLSKYNVQCCTIHVMATVHNGVQCWSHLNHNSNINGKKPRSQQNIDINNRTCPVLPQDRSVNYL